MNISALRNHLGDFRLADGELDVDAVADEIQRLSCVTDDSETADSARLLGSGIAHIQDTGTPTADAIRRAIEAI